MNIQELETEKRALIDKLRGPDGRKEETILNQIRAIEGQIKDAQLILKLNRVNREQSDLRQAAKQAWECEQPESDITTNDGSFHAVKVRKYPKIAALQRASGTWKDGRLTKIHIGRTSFEMFRTKFIAYGQPYEYTRPETFEDFLALNKIMQDDLSFEQYTEIIAKNEAINAEFKEAIKKFDGQKAKLGISALSYYGLFAQENAGHTYQYRPNY